LSQSAISQHLAKLRAAKLVKTQKEAQTVYYAIDSDAVYKILSTLIEIFIPPNIALASH
jgi:DNA-binding transcriptional ArsR family regulator